MFAFVTHETRLRPCSRAYSNAKRMIRSEPSRLIGLIEMPEPDAICLRLELVQLGDHVLRVVGAGLVLDAGVQVLGVLAHDHEVDVVVARAHARVRLAGAQAGVEAELVAQRDVDRAEAGADRRRDRAFQRDLVRLDRRERLLRQRRAGLLHHVDARLAHVPVELDAGRLEHPAGRLGQLGAGAVARNQGHAVGHPGSEGTDPLLAARSVLSAPREHDQRFQAGPRRRRRRRDRDHGARPRGRIAALPGRRRRAARREVPYENVWGLLVDNDLNSKMPDPEPYEPGEA